MVEESLISFCFLFLLCICCRVRGRFESISFVALGRLRLPIISFVFNVVTLLNMWFYIDENLFFWLARRCSCV